MKLKVFMEEVRTRTEIEITYNHKWKSSDERNIQTTKIYTGLYGKPLDKYALINLESREIYTIGAYDNILMIALQDEEETK